MKNNGSAGVSPNEVEYSKFVASFSTTSVGIVGGATKGPLTLTRLRNTRELHDIFGESSDLDYGVKAAEIVLSECDEVWYKRVVYKGDRAKAESEGDLIFMAKEGGTFLNTCTLDVTNPDENGQFKITLKKLEETLEEIEVSTNSVNDDYVYNKFNRDSKYLNIIFKSERVFKQIKLTLSGGTEGAKFATAGSSSEAFEFTSKYYDSTLNGCGIVVATDPDNKGMFQIILKRGQEILETINNLSTDKSLPNYVALRYNKNSQYFNVKHNEGQKLSYKMIQVQGGNDGIKGLSKLDIIGEGNSGMKAFDNPDTIDIATLIIPGWSDPEVVSAAKKLTDGRKDLEYLPDPPRGLTPRQVNDWVNATGAYSGTGFKIDSSYLGVYWPWVGVLNEVTGGYDYLPPSCFAAAQFAVNDRVADAWFAPAGLKRGKLERASKIEYETTKEERDFLYGGSNCINPIVNFSKQGITIWGNKTCKRNPVDTTNAILSSMNVRRMLNYVKKVIVASTLYLTFDINDSYTWNEWKMMVEPELRKIKTRRGLYDYKVQMDSTTVTPDDIDNLRMPGKVYLKPTRSAEYIPLDFIITPNGVTFNSDQGGDING